MQSGGDSSADEADPKARGHGIEHFDHSRNLMPNLRSETGPSARFHKVLMEVRINPGAKPNDWALCDTRCPNRGHGS
jgi:hypothetical protein